MDKPDLGPNEMKALVMVNIEAAVASLTSPLWSWREPQAGNITRLERAIEWLRALDHDRAPNG